MAINKLGLSFLYTIRRYVYLVPFVIISVGCASVGDLFDYGTNDNSEAVTQLDSEDTLSDLEQDSQPSNKNTNSDFSTYSLDDESETADLRELSKPPGEETSTSSLHFV